MKKMIVAALLCSTAFAANAADWSGPYLGVQGGAQFGTVSGPYEYADHTGSAPYSNKQNGGLLGLRAGYNAQFGNIVVGPDVDVNVGLGNQASSTDAFGDHVKSQNSWSSDLRLRAGYLFGNALVYAAGGLAFGDVKTSYSGVGQIPLSVTSQRVGYTAGAGVELAVAAHTTASIEYRYTDLGSKSFTSYSTDTFDNVKFNSSTVLLGLNYKF